MEALIYEPDAKHVKTADETVVQSGASKSGSGKFLPAIQGLRGFSAFIVFLYHVYDMSRKQSFFPSVPGWIPDVMRLGQQGVMVFFMISGFLIVGSLISHANVRRFLMDRAIRIYPVFLTIQLLSFVVGPLVGYKVFHGLTPGGYFVMFWENLLFLPGIFDLPLVQLNAWSLSFEALFYLIAAATYVVAFRAGRMPAWLFVSLVCVPLIWIYPAGIFFVVGAVIYFVRPDKIYSLPKFLSLLSLATMLMVLVVFSGNRWAVFAAAIPGALAFWSVVGGKCWLSSLLKTKPLLYMGTISYSFYLWHPVVTFPIKMLVGKYAARMGSVTPVLVFGVLGFAGSLLISHFSQKLLEDRLAKYLKGRFNRVKKGSQVVV